MSNKGWTPTVLMKPVLHLTVWAYNRQTQKVVEVGSPDIYIYPHIYTYWRPFTKEQKPKSPEAQADAKRFAGVKTWEGEVDE